MSWKVCPNTKIYTIVFKLKRGLSKYRPITRLLLIIDLGCWITHFSRDSFVCYHILRRRWFPPRNKLQSVVVTCTSTLPQAMHDGLPFSPPIPPAELCVNKALPLIPIFDLDTEMAPVRTIYGNSGQTFVWKPPWQRRPRCTTRLIPPKTFHRKGKHWYGLITHDISTKEQPSSAFSKRGITYINCWHVRKEISRIICYTWYLRKWRVAHPQTGTWQHGSARENGASGRLCVREYYRRRLQAHHER